MATKTVTICDECGDEMDSDRWYNGVRFHDDCTSDELGRLHPSGVGTPGRRVRGQFCIGCNIKLLKMELTRLGAKALEK